MINGFLLYVILQLDKLNAMMTVLFALSIVGFVLVSGFGLVFEDDIKDKQYLKTSRKLFLVFSCISVVILLLVPSTDSAIALLINDNLTADNIDKVVSSFKDCVAYLIDEISTINTIR